MDGFSGEGVDAGDAAKLGDAATPGDASNPSDAGTKPVCTGGRIAGIAAFDATPPGAKGTACGIANALIADDQVTGLDADDYGGSVVLAGQNVHGCVGVEFEAPLKTVYVRTAAAGNACGADCVSSFCGQGHYAEVFSGPTRGDYHFVGELTIGTSLAEQSLPVPSTTRIVVVCRGGSSRDRDDVVVDAITAACQ